jgi:O-acetylhomoserine/O-acetylserine sulfhydrylase-like pyridoxal-dependent enzyme
MLDHRLTDYGITTTFVDSANPDSVEAAIQDNTKVIYFETIANPTMKVAGDSAAGRYRPCAWIASGV